MECPIKCLNAVSNYHTLTKANKMHLWYILVGYVNSFCQCSNLLEDVLSDTENLAFETWFSSISFFFQKKKIFHNFWQCINSCVLSIPCKLNAMLLIVFLGIFTYNPWLFVPSLLKRKPSNERFQPQLNILILCIVVCLYLFVFVCIAVCLDISLFEYNLLCYQ